MLSGLWGAQSGNLSVCTEDAPSKKLHATHRNLHAVSRGRDISLASLAWMHVRFLMHAVRDCSPVVVHLKDRSYVLAAGERS